MQLTDDDGVIHFKYNGGKEWEYHVSSMDGFDKYTECVSEPIELEETLLRSSASAGYYIEAKIENTTDDEHQFWAGFWRNGEVKEFVDSSVCIEPHSTATLWMQGVASDPRGTTLEWCITSETGDPRLKITYKKV